MINLLSTRLLSTDQKKFLTNSGLHFQEYEAIRVHFKEFQLDDNFDHYIFTSQNAVKSFLKRESLNLKNKELTKSCFCVGEKTKLLLEENDHKVIKMTKNASELGYFISKNYKNDSFLFFCGNRRLNDLPEILIKNKLHFKELEVYQTILIPQQFSESFDGILFFSPSGVQSFTTANELGKSTAFCIGDTTAREAALHTDSIVVADNPTIESLLKRVTFHYNLSIEK